MLISLIIFALIVALIYWVLTIIPLPQPFRTIVLVIFAVICLVYLLQFLGALPPMEHTFYRR